MAKIVVNIASNGPLCGSCRLRRTGDKASLGWLVTTAEFCTAFGNVELKPNPKNPSGNSYLRCPRCVKAEVK
jgi:hypothetical protein